MTVSTIWQGGIPACFSQALPQAPAAPAAPMAAREWTERDLRAMRQRYAALGAVGMAAQLGRTVTAVRNRAQRMGLEISDETRSRNARAAAVVQQRRARALREKRIGDRV